MARPKSEDKRNAILAAATRVIVAQGLGASTAAIAKEAGIANGSLFTYFETKSDLLNALYLALKSDMAEAAMAGVPAAATLREQLFHSWSNWMQWAMAEPEKRRALAQLTVSDEITPACRAAGNRAMAAVGALMQRVHANGALRETPMSFAAAIMNSMAEATMDFMVSDPARAREHCQVGFDALWRVLA
jgi:AcrR family transcriptional regulator